MGSHGAGKQHPAGRFGHNREQTGIGVPLILVIQYLDGNGVLAEPEVQRVDQIIVGYEQLGAGAIVVDSVPPNSVAAGNPARVVKRLDPEETFTTRSEFFSNPVRLSREFMAWEQAMLRGKTIFGWLRHLLFPAKGD